MTDPRFRLSAEEARRLAARFGTPLYVVDEGAFRRRIQETWAAARAAWPRPDLSYASKANPTPMLMRIAFREGMAIDVASEGEARAALFAGVDPARIHLHGNAKSDEILALAQAQGFGMIVLDHEDEIGKLAPGTPVMLRLAPGVDPRTDDKISTGRADTKFGFPMPDAEHALRTALDRGLAVKGFHCHVGSQAMDPAAQRNGGRVLAEFAARMEATLGFRAERINVGGGRAVRYTDEEPVDLAGYTRSIADALREALGRDDLVMEQEPGRSLVAEAGVTLYTVRTVKRAASGRVFVSVDGGLSDNPRPALYSARYAVERPGGWEYVMDGPGAAMGVGRIVATVAGAHCETDTLFPDIELPADVAPGDLLQVLTTGAYGAAMASNYNRFLRPAQVLRREDASAFEMQRRETWDDLTARDRVSD